MSAPKHDGDLETAIKLACRVNRKTQDQVAHEVGIDPGLFSKIAAGKLIPNVFVAGRIALVLNLHVEDLWPIHQTLRQPIRIGRPRKPTPVTP